jgi:ubiquinone/menaquinone biosynthesis C-methylase UbiE
MALQTQPQPIPQVSTQDRLGAGWYTPLSLHLYDLWVLNVSGRFAWRCPTVSVLEPFFNANIGEHYLDVGVGTGYFPALAMKDATKLKTLTLVDLNPNTLQTAAGRIAQPDSTRCVVADALSPLPILQEDGTSERFDSISLMYLMHCLLGPAASKTRVFANMKGHLAEGGTLFGATVLGSLDGRVKHNWFGKALLWAYNRVGIFDNYEDNQADFVKGLEENFEEVEVFLFGCVLIFKAEKPIR